VSKALKIINTINPPFSPPMQSLQSGTASQTQQKNRLASGLEESRTCILQSKRMPQKFMQEILPKQNFRV